MIFIFKQIKNFKTKQIYNLSIVSYLKTKYQLFDHEVFLQSSLIVKKRKKRNLQKKRRKIEKKK